MKTHITEINRSNGVSGDPHVTIFFRQNGRVYYEQFSDFYSNPRMKLTCYIKELKVGDIVEIEKCKYCNRLYYHIIQK